MDSLQFQKAEFSGDAPKCASCRNSLENTYFQLSQPLALDAKPSLGSTAIVNQDLCGDCAEKIRELQGRPQNAAVLRGVAYGAGMAILCAIGYAVISVAINMQFALIAILVGYLVGSAVRKGSNGLGGRRCQIAAVALTYFAITFSYIPLFIQEMGKSQTQEQGKNTTPNVSKAAAGASDVLMAFVVLGGLALAAPLLELQSGFSGVIGLLIIFFGLQRAWKLTERDGRMLVGPLQRVRETEPSGLLVSGVEQMGAERIG